MRDIFALILISSVFTGAVMLLLCVYDKRLGNHLSPRKRTTAASLTLLLQPLMLALATALSFVADIFDTAGETAANSDVTAVFIDSFIAPVTITEVTTAAIQDGTVGVTVSYSLDFGLIFGILTCLWLAGVLATALYKIVSYLRFVHNLKKSLSPCECGTPIPAFTSPQAGTPFLMGFFRAKIILPEKQMDEAELELAIKHEMIHHKRHDIQKKFFAEMLKCLNWFNPAFYVFAGKLSELSELAVDEILSSELDHTGRKAYGGLLLKFASTGTGNALCSGLSRAASNLAARLEVIMTEGKRKVTKGEKIALATLAVVVVAVVGLSIGICAAAMPEGEETTDITTVVPNDEIVFVQEEQGVGQRVIEIDESKTIESYAIEQDPVDGFSKISDVGEKLDEDEIDGDIPTRAVYALSLTGSGDDIFSISDIAYTNGQVMVLGDDDMAISLSEGIEVTVRIVPDFSPDYSNTDGNGEHAEVGYILDGEAVEIFNGFIQEDGCEVTFTAEEAGDYLIYIANYCAGMQNYASVEVEIN